MIPKYHNKRCFSNESLVLIVGIAQLIRNYKAHDNFSRAISSFRYSTTSSPPDTRLPFLPSAEITEKQYKTRPP